MQKYQHNQRTDKPDAVAHWLDQACVELDITETQYQDAVDKYTTLAQHLSQPGSELSPYLPDIKPQGSFILGTMIQPLKKTGTLDVDLVCRLQGKKAAWTQQQVKEAIGQQLVQSEYYKQIMDEEGNRCWTLVYGGASGFHMDILPAIAGCNHFILLDRSFNDQSNGSLETMALRITDKRLNNYNKAPNPDEWPKSNPFGYAAWFGYMAALNNPKSLLLSKAIEPLPQYRKDKEPLVRVVQLLKRHRDMMYGGHACKPISIIITTLAALAYRKETNLLTAAGNILSRMEDLIEIRYSEEHQRTVRWIGNPVNPEENFADRWTSGPDGPLRERFFREWLHKARADFLELQHTVSAPAFIKTILGVDIDG